MLADACGLGFLDARHVLCGRHGTFLAGTFGQAGLLIFPNKRKDRDTDPDYLLFAAPGRDRRPAQPSRERRRYAKHETAIAAAGIPRVITPPIHNYIQGVTVNGTSRVMLWFLVLSVILISSR